MSFRASKRLKRICGYKKADFDFVYMQWSITGELYGQGEELREQLAYLRRVYAKRFGQHELKLLCKRCHELILAERQELIDRAQVTTLPQRAARSPASRDK